VRAQISRRTLARGAAWSAPVIAVGVAAPAYATSVPCQVQTNFDNLTPGTKPTTLTFLPSTITASIAYASTGNGGDNTPGGTGQVAATSTNPSWNYIEVEMLKQLTAGDTVTVTITFTQPVTNLNFRIHDIDTENGQWVDHVVINTPGYTYVRGTDVIGNGSASGNTTNTGPFRNVKFQDQAIDSGRNHVDLTWAGPVQVVQFTYKAGITGNSGNQHIGIGNISFSDCVANPQGLAAPTPRALSRGGGFVPGESGLLVAGRDN
jgi:hypothetical protein